MRVPPASMEICAEPSTWPAGEKRTLASPMRMVSRKRRLLGRAGEILAVAHGHDAQGLPRRQDGAMARAGMVRMAMGDQRPFDGADRIDVEVAEGAVEPLRGLGEDVGGTQRHGSGI